MGPSQTLDRVPGPRETFDPVRFPNPGPGSTPPGSRSTPSTRPSTRRRRVYSCDRCPCAHLAGATPWC